MFPPIPRKLSWTLVALLAVTAAVYVRMYPLRAHIWSDSSEQARLIVVMKLKTAFREQLARANPDMPVSAIAMLADQKVNETLRKENAKVRSAIERVNAELHAQKDADNEPIYLLESDPFYYYNLTNNVLKTGKLSRTAQGTKYLNPLMLAPDGMWQPYNVLPFLGAWLYKIIHCFAPNMSVMAVVSFVPVILSALAVLAFLWAGATLKFSPWAAGTGAFLLGLTPVFLQRGSLGWYDTDPFNVLFPLILFTLTIKALTAPRRTQSLAWGLGYAAMLSLYSLFWHGWGFILVVTLSSVALNSLRVRLAKEETVAVPHKTLFITILLGVVVGISCVFGAKAFFVLIREALIELRDFRAEQIKLWPDLFLAVGELKKSSWSAIMISTGGPLLLFGSLAGILAAAVSCLKDKSSFLRASITALFVYLGIASFLQLSAERFAILNIVPLALFFAFAVNAVMNVLRNRFASMIIFVILGGLALMHGERAVRTILTPIYNSTWEQVLVDIRDKTPADTIVNTWWPPGHFIKGVAERAVIFDGASLKEGAAGYWLSNILLSADENEAAGLIRMLNTSRNRAVEYLQGLGWATASAVELVKKLAIKDRAEAATVLRSALEPPEVTTLLSLTHGKNPNSVILLYNELVENNLILAFTGKWNIHKAETLRQRPDLLAKVPQRRSKDFIPFLWTMVDGGMPKYSEALALAGKGEDRMVFQQNISIALNASGGPLVTVDSAKFGRGVPQSLVCLDNGKVVEKKLSGSSLSYSAVLYEEDGRPVCRLMDRDLANSLLVKLYFFDGKGLRRFQPLSEARDLTGQTNIKAFSVVWQQ